MTAGKMMCKCLKRKWRREKERDTGKKFLCFVKVLHDIFLPSFLFCLNGSFLIFEIFVCVSLFYVIKIINLNENKETVGEVYTCVPYTYEGNNFHSKCVLAIVTFISSAFFSRKKSLMSFCLSISKGYCAVLDLIS